MFSFFWIFSSDFLNSQDIDINDKFLERLERIEKIYLTFKRKKLKILKTLFLQGIFLGMNSRFDDIETKNRLNYGIIEEIQNKINGLEDKLNLIDSEFQSRVKKIKEEAIDKSTKKQRNQLVRKKLNLTKEFF